MELAGNFKWPFLSSYSGIVLHSKEKLQRNPKRETEQAVYRIWRATEYKTRPTEKEREGGERERERENDVPQVNC